jgi:hypothetical protein
MRKTPSLDPTLPAELLAAITREAMQDADDVAALLAAFGFQRPSPGAPPQRLPAPLLLGLGAAVRTLRWEAQGVRLHIERGMPTGDAAVREVFRRAAADAGSGSEGRFERELCRDVLRLAASHFAWEGPEALGTDMVLGEVEDERLLDAVARMIWAQRHSTGEIE